MAKADGGSNTVRMPLGRAYALLVKGHGSPRLAEMELRKKYALDRDRRTWGYLQKIGDAPDHELWPSARFNFPESSARAGYGMFFIGGVGGEQSTEWLGLWVLAEHEEADGYVSTKKWIVADLELMKRDGVEIPSGITDRSRKLHKRMHEAAKVDRRVRPVTVRRIENVLRELGL